VEPEPEEQHASPYYRKHNANKPRMVKKPIKIFNPREVFDNLLVFLEENDCPGKLLEDMTRIFDTMNSARNLCELSKLNRSRV
jgi:hypothetical protein